MELEEFAPKLVSGSVLVADGQSIFLREGKKKAVLLPPEVSVPLSFFNGKKSVQEIGEELYKKNGRVQIKSLFQSLRRLAELGLLENSQEFAKHFEKQVVISERPLPFFFRPILTIPLSSPFKDERNFPALFALFSAVLIGLSAFFSYTYWPDSLPTNWLRVEGEYLKGLILIWLVHSLALSFQGLFQSILTFFGSSIFPGIELAFSPFGIYLKTNEVGDGLKRSIWHRLAYLLASTGTPLLGVCLVLAFLNSDELVHHLKVLLPAYLLVLFDPYRKSQLSHFFVEISGAARREDLLPYLKKRSLVAITRNREKIQNEIVLILFSTVAIVWSFLAYDFLIELSIRNLPNVLAAVMYEGGVQMIVAGVIFLILAGFSLYLAFEILSTLFVNIIQPVMNPILRLRSKNRVRKEALSPEQIKETLRKTHLFGDLGETFLNRVAEAVEPKRYPPGSLVVIQGEKAVDLFVIAQGEVAVEKRTHAGTKQRFTTLASGAVIGESALIDGSQRGADVVALEPTVVLKISRSFFDAAHDEENYKRILGRIMTSQFASNSELFKGLPVETTSLVTALGEVEEFESGHAVIERGSPSKDFYLLLRGQVEVASKENTLATLGDGSFFGEVALIANVPRTAKVTTLEPTTVLKLSAENFWKIINRHVNLALYLETVADLRMTNIQEEGR